jgi:PAS domain S-box-containing protein
MSEESAGGARWLAYGVAVLGVGAATGARLALEPVLGREAVPFITFFPAVLLTTWFGGLRPGLLSVVLGGMAADYFFMRPMGSLLLGAADWVSLVLFGLVGAGIAWLGDSQKRAVARAILERQRFETTLAGIADAVIATDAAGIVVFANAAARDLLRSSSDPVGQPLDAVFRIVNEHSRAAVESPVARVLREGRVVGLANHTVLLAGDGTEIPIDDSAAPLRDGVGALSGTVLVFRDVGEQRRGERARRLLASIVESTEDAILSKDLDGTITSWNAAAERMFGYAAEEILGKPVSVLAMPGSNEMPEILARIRRGEQIEHYETVRRKKNGDPVDVSLTVSPIRDVSGRIVGASKIVRDVTGRRRAERELRETNEALLRTNEDLERFGFLASHDLQEPLRMITAYAQLLARTLSLPPEDERREFLRHIVEGAGRMRALIGDLLTYTRMRLEPEEPSGIVDLNVVLDVVRNNLRTSIEENGAEIAAEPLPPVRGHEAHFLSLFQNLVENAIKYRSEAPPRIRVSAERSDGRILFAVADNGIGVAPQYREKIFQAFTRLHGGDVPGTGVGLAICRRIVERYGGRIWAEQGHLGGATFRFALPDSTAAGGPQA